jgi:transcriptional regulator with XRE-family HTH domain
MILELGCADTESGVMMAQWNNAGAEVDPSGGPRTLANVEDLAVGARIRALRGERGWSAHELAEEWKRASADALDRSQISKLETGRRKLSAEEAVWLARIFGVTTDYLLGTSGKQGVQARERVLAEASAEAGAASRDKQPDLGDVRRPEVDQIMSWLGSGRAPHALLVLGPPGIGKSMLASQLVREAAKGEAGWATTMVDVRDLEPEARTDADGLISRMFDLDRPTSDGAPADNPAFAGTAVYRSIAQRISKAGKPVLCVVDSADELTDSASVQLRSALSAVYSQVQRTGKPGVRLAFVVTSRLEDGWLGKELSPSLDIRPLPEFGVDVVEDRLRLLADRTREGGFSAAEFANWAAIVHGVSAGLPPLLDPFLSWVGNEEWLDIHRLESADVFESLAGPYIQNTLLAPQSLFPRAVKVPSEQVAAIREAIRLLVRYRLFTRSHLRHHVETDEELRAALKRAGWQQDDLWVALSGMALLKKPLGEIWQEFHPAIRKLLFRHYYPTDQSRASAHEEARAYVAEWADAQLRKDRVVGRIEGLWHTVSALRLSRAKDFRQRILVAAAEAGSNLDVTETYPLSDLSAYAANRIARDAEMQAAIGDTELAAEVQGIVLAWA